MAAVARARRWYQEMVQFFVDSSKVVKSDRGQEVREVMVMADVDESAASR